MRRRLIRWRDATASLARRHPFALSLFVMLLIVIPAFVRVEQIQRQACERSNDARHDQIVLWSYIIKQTPNTADERARVTAFDARLHEIFKSRKCS
jgi:hypothetical protein